MNGSWSCAASFDGERQHLASLAQICRGLHDGVSLGGFELSEVVVLDVDVVLLEDFGYEFVRTGDAADEFLAFFADVGKELAFA